MPDILSVIEDTVIRRGLDKDSFIGKILPDGWEPFVVQLLAMAVLVTVVFVFLFKPVRKILDARREKTMSEIAEAEKKNANAGALLNEAEERVKASKTEAVAIVERAKKDAESLRDQTIVAAKDEAQRLREEAKKDIEMSKVQAQDDINRSIVDVALQASEKVLKREVDEADSRRLIDDFLSEING